MGATDFETVAWGRTADEAFRSARDRAQWDHGHAGYTGTIAEKGAFVQYTLPPRQSVVKLLAAIDAHENGVEYLREDLARAEASLIRVGTADKRDVRRRITRLKADVKKAERVRATAERKAGPLWAIAERAYPVWRDKWGPAVCVELSGAADLRRYGSWAGPKPGRGYKLYLFCGLASS